MIPKGFESKHLKEIPLGRKVVNLKSKSTKKVAQKPRKIDCPPGLSTLPLFPLYWVFSVDFLLFWKLTKQLNV